VHDCVNHLRVVAHALFEQAGERRKHQRAIDSELVHQFESRSRFAKRGDAAHRLARQFAHRLPLGVAVFVEVFVRTGARNDLERGVRDVIADRPAHDDLGAATHAYVVDRVLVLAREMPRERVLGFVQVVVGIEDGKITSTVHTRSRRSN
jgi:hypothetical protein